jgi:hypothetical protein
MDTHNFVKIEQLQEECPIIRFLDLVEHKDWPCFVIQYRQKYAIVIIL